MKEIYIGASTTLESAIDILKEKEKEYGEPVMAMFNEVKITSDMSVDDAYLAVTGICRNNAKLFDDIWPFIHGLVLDLSKDKDIHEKSELLHSAHEDFKYYLRKKK